MKTKLLVPLLALLLTGCGEEEEVTVNPTPEPDSLCYLQEQTTDSEVSQSSVRYSYNDLNQVVRTEHYVQEELQEIHTYTYTSEGRLAMSRLLNAEGEEISFTSYSYNPDGRLSRYEVRQPVPGLATMHRLATFRVVYDDLGRLTSATDYLYLNNGEVPNGAVSQTYPRTGGVVATVRDPQGQTLYTATFEQDTSRWAPLSAVPVYQHRRPGVGYPNRNVITSFNATTGTGEEATPVEDVAYTAEYTYNEQGYPVTGTLTYAGGRIEQVSYTYNCAE